MAVGYGYLTAAGFWAPPGHVVSAFAFRPEDARAPDYLDLRQGEIFAHLKYYLQAQGDVALQCIDFIVRENKVSEDTLKKEPLLEKWLAAAYRRSLETTSDIGERVRLRERIKALATGLGKYKPDVRWHKPAPIVWPLVDFGLVETSMEGNGRRLRCFSPKVCGPVIPLSALLSGLPLFDGLQEEDKKGTLLRVLSTVYGFDLSAGTTVDFSVVFPGAYRKVRMLPTGTASLAALYDICSIRGILDRRVWISPAQVLSALEDLQICFPGDVRFQYGRAGRKSSVIVTDKVLSSLSDEAVSVLKEI
jgi:hypothetical protein